MGTFLLMVGGPWPPHERFGPALVALATVAAGTFVVLYAGLSHGAWLRTKVGRHLMILTGGLFALGAHSLAWQIFGGWDWGWLGDYRDHRELIYLILAYQLIQRCILLVQAHRFKSRDSARLDHEGR